MGLRAVDTLTMSGVWLKIGHRLSLLKVTRFWWVAFPLAYLAVSGCRSAPENSPPTATPSSPYAAEMAAQGFVELVGDDLAPAPMPPEPSQGDLGAEVYRQICLACHGDWGQGLTDAWREEWGEDSNCWQSKCHASNHPPEGFDLPKNVPAVLGPGSLARFDTAADLQRNIAQTMPWWNPGSLTEEQTWQLTAYLMRVRGELGDEVTLDAGNAAVYKLHVSYAPVPNPRPGIFLLISSLVLVAVIYAKKGNSPAAG